MEEEKGTLISVEIDTGYRPEMCQVIIDAAKEGKHVAGMCSLLGIKSRDTFYRWLKLYPEFAEAYDTAKLESQALLEHVGMMGVMGNIKGFSFPAWAMLMNNKFPDDYTRSANGVAPGNTINIGSINSIETNPKELEERIKQLNKQLGYFDKVTIVEEDGK